MSLVRKASQLLSDLELLILAVNWSFPICSCVHLRDAIFIPPSVITAPVCLKYLFRCSVGGLGQARRHPVIKEKQKCSTKWTISGNYLVLRKHLLPSLRGKETRKQRNWVPCLGSHCEQWQSLRLIFRNAWSSAPCLVPVASLSCPFLHQLAAFPKGGVGPQCHREFILLPLK